MKTKLIFILLFFSLLFSCKKDEDTAPVQQTTGGAGGSTYTYLDTSMTPYKFKLGTYWVYENDSTFAIDSVIIDSVYSGFYGTYMPHGLTNYSEIYKMYFQHFGTSEYYNQSLLGIYVFRNWTQSFPSFTAQPVFVTNRPIGFSVQGMTIEGKLSSMNIGTSTFTEVDNVKISAVDQSVPVFIYDTHLYFCDSVGLIKKETEISPGNIESWSLKRWNIIR